jgi:S1-C subfamily serine protease
VKNVKKIEVTFYNKESVRASFITYNKETSLGLLKIKSQVISERTRSKIEEIKLGESFQSSAGVPVLGLGAPDGTLGSMAIGYITASRIDKYVVDGKLGLYHTNIMENPYAEGFFVNLSGQVIGFTTHRFKDKTDQNTMSFLGIERLKGIIQGMLNEKKQAYLGIKVCELSSNDLKRLNVHYGIYITDVMADSPAFKNGIRTGDVITEIDNSCISSVTALMEKLSEKSPGDEMELQVMRQKKVEYPKVSYVRRKHNIKLG